MTTLRLPHSMTDSRAARASLRADLGVAGVQGRTVADAELLIGELVANAVEHGRADGDGMIEVSWEITGDCLVLSVWDAGSTPEPLRPGSLTSDEARGRGLALVAAISSSWAHDGRHGTRVTAELELR